MGALFSVLKDLFLRRIPPYSAILKLCWKEIVSGTLGVQ